MFVFWANQATKNRFRKFWIKKNAFETRKRKFSKLLTYGNFSKGLVNGFGYKNRIFYHVSFLAK